IGRPAPLCGGVRSSNHDRRCDRRDAWVELSFRPETITSGPLVGMAEPSTRAKWRALRSARSSTLKKCLTGIHIVREAILRQQRQMCPDLGWSKKKSAEFIHSALGLSI